MAVPASSTGSYTDVALQELYDRHAAWLRSLCGRLLGHRDALEVDDAVQQVFIVLARSDHHITDERAIVVWFRRTALHLCANISRSRRARRTEVDHVPLLREMPTISG